ncbi:LysR family transcriptional regulator [Pseudomonas fluorescens]|uniref:PCP degradation transcriptional activation protein n=1 Tax=Pseudomonas fluorescens TaxID=294 RepID=A0A5E7FE18_PSEFL|nr:LysR family transcriptional regulator [Pseudomonas fluorescens]VVO36287.1 PCP degradation transcriptional activation protein [Pseudomonas fluorescens]VVQ18816.1 PCP degradation transcriptional activation protein [Pseudomonas fluorescens]
MSTFDLNLIPTFVALHETASVTATAERLHVTQPSISYALGKLREHFDDPLFIRNRNGMQPTRLANSLYACFKDVSQNVDSAIAQARKFDPATSTRSFRLALSDMGELAFLPRVLGHLNRVAPFVELEVIPVNIELAAQWLNEGHVDAVICSRVLAGPGITYHPVLLQHYVCVLAADHPRVGESLSMEQFLAEPHVLVNSNAMHNMPEEVLQTLKIKRRVRLRLPHFSVLPNVLPGTDMLTILPSQIAGSFCRHPVTGPLKMLELPFKIPSFYVNLHWHVRSEQSSALKWFCSELRIAVEGMVE